MPCSRVHAPPGPRYKQGRLRSDLRFSSRGRNGIQQGTKDILWSLPSESPPVKTSIRRHRESCVWQLQITVNLNLTTTGTKTPRREKQEEPTVGLPERNTHKSMDHLGVSFHTCLVFKVRSNTLRSNFSTFKQWCQNYNSYISDLKQDKRSMKSIAGIWL